MEGRKQSKNAEENQKGNGAISKNLKSKTELAFKRERFEASNVKSIRLLENVRPENSFKPKMPASKYVNLIDQSDVKWFAEISGRKLIDELKDTLQTDVSANETNLVSKTKKKDKILSYAPIVCPIFNCGIHFLPNDMIMHFLNFHFCQQMPIQQLYEKQRLLITMEPFELMSEEIICLGLVSYSGKDGKSLAERNICVEQNLFLHKSFDPLKGDYPILILASVISMGVFSEEGNEKADDIQLNKKNFSTMLIIWLAGADVNLPVASTITTYDECRLYSRSVIVSLHSLYKRQTPYEVCNSDKGYFRLHFNELSTFVNSKMTLKLEFVFYEDFVISLKK